MTAWRLSPVGVLIPTTYRPSGQARSAPAPCPPAIRERLRELRAEFAKRAGMR
ncbi:hypothetical protein [Hydrogenophaga intermedia]|uniref:hypothetical protein n=1 Tax=Hydrogenophaga intermedia TaxID=65786 RepID=UPI002043673C|nr:hypothetical protein [Hydrogenophaga intermedia]MCM3565938.1 hypothetical protein [Hydrogenophaga intermedia]